jgi:Ulp1 family protease
MRPFDKDERMLNDSLIEFGILHALHQSISKEQTISKYYFAGTKLFTKFLEYVDRFNSHYEAYRQVCRWTKPVDIFSKEVILFPIHESLHWYLIAFCNIGSVLANVGNKTVTNVDDPALIFVMDSLPKNLNYYKRNIMNLCAYLSLEYLAKKMTTLQVATTGVGFLELNDAVKKVPRVILKSPTQPNDYDCGMYLIRNCRNIISNYPSLKRGELYTISSEKTISPMFDYSNEDIQEDRSLMFEAIVSTYKESMDYEVPQTHVDEHPKKSTLCEQDFSTPNGLDEAEASTFVDIRCDHLSFETGSGNCGKRKASHIVQQESFGNKKESVFSRYAGYSDYDFFNL